MSLITKFDPWRSTLCTCPPKLTFNPYTGCDHMCIYCYASTYVPRFFNCRPKKALLSRLEREASGLKGETISIANSSDPYPSLEAEKGLTRKCLEILTRNNCKIQIITKSSLVIRDTDLLKKVPSMVSMTITTDDDKTAKLIEPNAPSSSKRLKTVSALAKKGIRISVRIDPIIPFLNDQLEGLIRELDSIGVQHVTGSTLKIKPATWKRFHDTMPNAARQLEPLYFEGGEKLGGYIYLPKDLRFRLLKTARDLTAKYGMRFGTCREGLSRLNTAACDGSWLMKATEFQTHLN